MKPEIEAKFLAVDHDALRQKLTVIGAECVSPMRIMKRKHYDFTDRRLRRDKNAWVRVRDEGNKITISYKELRDRTLHGTHEICLTVDSFDQADALFKALGMEVISCHETKRESWRLGSIEIELDHWPWTKPYVEIEASDENALRRVVRDLDLDWTKALHGSVEVVYTAEYDISESDMNSWPEITFVPVPDWLEAKRKKGGEV